MNAYKGFIGQDDKFWWLFPGLLKVIVLCDSPMCINNWMDKGMNLDPINKNVKGLQKEYTIKGEIARSNWRKNQFSIFNFRPWEIETNMVTGCRTTEVFLAAENSDHFCSSHQYFKVTW